MNNSNKYWSSCNRRSKDPNWNSKDYLQTINRNGEIAPIVINQFLNLLCFVANYADSNCQMPKMILTKISNDCCKAKAQLNLDASKIVAFSPLAMKSIIDALMVLQFKCGIYNVSQIDYNLLLFPLSYIMYLYESKTIGKDKLDNLIIIRGGITKDKSIDAVNIVKKILKDLEAGKIDDDRIEKAKEYYTSAIDDIIESPFQIIESYYMIELLGVDDIETKRKKMLKVTKDEIIAVAKKVKINTVYILEGSDDNGEN